MPGEPADMHLVDDRLRKGPAERRIPLPVIGAGVDDDALQRRSGIVPPMLGGLPAATCRPGNALAIRVEQYLVGIETQPSRGIERSSDAIGVDLTRDKVWYKDVPVMIGTVGPRIESDDPRRPRSVHVVEQQQLRCGTMLGEHAEIGAAGDESRTERKALAFLANHGLHPPVPRRLRRSAVPPLRLPASAVHP
jgi:hypothetical protein